MPDWSEIENRVREEKKSMVLHPDGPPLELTSGCNGLPSGKVVCVLHFRNGDSIELADGSCVYYWRLEQVGKDQYVWVLSRLSCEVVNGIPVITER